MKTKIKIVWLLLCIFLPFFTYAQTNGIFEFTTEKQFNKVDDTKFSFICNKPYVCSPKLFKTTTLNKKILNDELLINLDDSKKFSAEKTNSKIEGDDITWVGRPKNDKNIGNYVIISKTKKGIYGSIYYNNIKYTIYTINELYSVLYEVDQSNLPEDDSCDIKVKYEESRAISDGSTNNLNTTRSTIIYDVLFAYTPAAAAACNIDGLIDIIEEEANSIYSTCQIQARMNVVHRMQVNYSEISISTDLAHLHDHDNVIDEVHTYRTQYGADVVVLIVDSDGSAAGQAATVDAYLPSQGFAVVQYEHASDNYVFLHEIGHLFGCDHEIDNDLYNDIPYPYNHGFKRKTYPKYKTIMATAFGDPSVERKPYFSTPSFNIMIDGSTYPIGSVDDENSSRVHNERANVIANFMDLPLIVDVTGPTFLYFGINGDYTASGEGGSGTYINYKWWMRNDESVVPLSRAPTPGVWIYLSEEEGNIMVDNYNPGFDFSLKCEITDSEENTVEDIISIVVEGISFSNNQNIPTFSLNALPGEIELMENSPNPFNPTTNIKFGLPKSQKVEISVYSLTGEKVKTLVNNTMEAGYHIIIWNATDKKGAKVSSGVYIYQLKCGNEIFTKNMIFAK